MDEVKVKTYKVTVSFDLKIIPAYLETEGGHDLTPIEYAGLFVEDALSDLLDEWEVASVVEVPA